LCCFLTLRLIFFEVKKRNLEKSSIKDKLWARYRYRDFKEIVKHVNNGEVHHLQMVATNYTATQKWFASKAFFGGLYCAPTFHVDSIHFRWNLFVKAIIDVSLPHSNVEDASQWHSSDPFIPPHSIYF